MPPPDEATMPEAAAPPLAPLLRRIGGFGPLAAPEAALLARLEDNPAQVFEGRSIIHAEGDCPPPAVLLSGWGCQARILPDGRHQIITFLLPGDVIGRLPPQMPAVCTALAISRVTLLPAGPLLAAAADAARFPGLARAVRVMRQIDEALLRNQIVRLGRQTAYERLAGLLLECLERLEATGLARHDSFTLSVSQDALGDALGLSAVHINRTLQQLRRDGLVDLRGKLVMIRERAALQALAHWQPLPHPAN